METREFIKKVFRSPESTDLLSLGKEAKTYGLQDDGSYFYDYIDGVPVLLTRKEDYVDMRTNTESTNPYSPKSLELIRNNPNKWILDFGAGNPSDEELFDNVVRMDFIQYKTCDVVSNLPLLPFENEAFDHIISESVFEHVKDPWLYASELHRVLKPGGKIIVDTAFLQPVHGDPFHFYNMSLEAVCQVFSIFKQLDSGVEPYQSPGTTLNLMIRQFIDLVGDETKKNEIRQLVGHTDFSWSYDKYIPKDRWHVMAAGVYFVGEKMREVI